jgi:hypothetical protein
LILQTARLFGKDHCIAGLIFGFLFIYQLVAENP